MPSWIPDGYILDYVEVSPLIGQIIFSASYIDSQRTISIEYSYPSDNKYVSSMFEKDGESVLEYTKGNIMHYIMSNENALTIAWMNGTCECSIWGDISYDEAQKIIDSIYI